ncbi:MAG: NifB/NifX family molybdenum-iron cluster-binding protein [Desulfovibrionaceae bacterium]
MKIAVSCQGDSPDSPVDPRFGRTSGFLVYDTDAQTYERVDNQQNLSLPQGAGLQTAQNVAQTGAQAVISGHVGPKAFKALQKGGVQMFLAEGLSVQQAVDKYLAGELEAASEADREGHW